MTYEQGYEDYWNNLDPQDDSSDYMDGWYSAECDEADEEDEYWEEVIKE